MSTQAQPRTEKPTLDTCLVGMIETWPLVDLLVWLHQSRRTAMVRVGDGFDAGVIFLQDGELARCEWQKQRGEDALVSLLTKKRGSFALIQRAVPEIKPNIRTPTAELLLQCTMGLDENRRLHQA